jgi:hypothetical protein
MGKVNAREERAIIMWSQKYCWPKNEADAIDKETALRSWFTTLPLNSDMIKVLYPHIDEIKALYESTE